jgi:hypothetical protein
MTDLTIEQALFENEEIVAHSAGFADAWSPTAANLIRGFGSPPPDSTVLTALLVRPFGRAFVAIVRVSWPRFHFLVLGRELYNLLHDPFAIAERYPPDWHARGSLAALAWPAEPLPKRTVAMLDAVLKNGDGPFLLGASQTLVDGGKIVLQRPEPQERLLRDLWALLPDSVRRSIWPATYVFSNDLGFDLLVMPALPDAGLPGCLGEDQVRDYPDSRYERHLQVAIEAGDQSMLDRLLSRKSTNEMIRLALIIIAVSLGVGAMAKVLSVLHVV